MDFVGIVQVLILHLDACAYCRDFDIEEILILILILHLAACGYCRTLTVVVVENWRRRERLDWRLKTEDFD